MLPLIIVIVYFIAMITLGLSTRKQARSAGSYFVAGRSGSTLFITGSLLATIIGASATIGMAGLGFAHGLTGAWWILSGSVGLVVLGFLFARKVREYGFYTLPALIEKQYGRVPALAASILIVVAWMAVIAGQIIAAGTIMTVLGYGSPTLWIWVSTAVFIFYTVLGGQRAALKTDLWQTIIIFLGIFAGLAFVLWKVGGFTGLKNGLPANYFSFPVSAKFSPSELLNYLLLVGLTYVVGPDMYSRIFSAKDGQVAKKSVFWTAGLLIPLALGITLIGMTAAVLYPNIAAGQAFPTVIKGVMPPVLVGLVLAALLSAVMSSAVTCLLSVSTILTTDVIHKFKPAITEDKLLVISKWGIVILGLLALGVALQLKEIINSLLYAYTIFTAGIIPIVIAGFWREKLKITNTGALTAIVVGGASALIMKIYTGGLKDADTAAALNLLPLAVSTILLFAVSWGERVFLKQKTVLK
ncbi:MAG: sodium:solute symporter family protein [Dehalococcoidales bacterium]